MLTRGFVIRDQVVQFPVRLGVLRLAASGRSRPTTVAPLLFRGAAEPFTRRGASGSCSPFLVTRRRYASAMAGAGSAQRSLATHGCGSTSHRFARCEMVPLTGSRAVG